jgi:hypothetical protein
MVLVFTTRIFGDFPFIIYEEHKKMNTSETSIQRSRWDKQPVYINNKRCTLYGELMPPGYVEVLWGIDADPKVSVVSVALVVSDLTQP